jgi:uncharacterized protein (TIGR00255 family)
MMLKSMTGFARHAGSHGAVSWHWEAKSVNNRGLDVRVRLAPGYETLEPFIRDELTKRFLRGSVSVSLNLDQHQRAATEVRLNEAVLANVIAAAERVRAMTGAEPARVEGLLGIRGVLEVVDVQASEAEMAACQSVMMSTLGVTLDALAEARAAEGQRLHAVITAQIDDIAARTITVESAPARTVEAIRARLVAQVRKLIDTDTGLDPARLNQEAVMLATRADVDEELKRLKAHVEAARDLLAKPLGAGRKLDFLAQELNREANTLTSKANDNSIAAEGLAMKSTIDQLREQVQNIE